MRSQCEPADKAINYCHMTKHMTGDRDIGNRKTTDCGICIIPINITMKEIKIYWCEHCLRDNTAPDMYWMQGSVVNKGQHREMHNGSTKIKIGVLPFASAKRSNA